MEGLGDPYDRIAEALVSNIATLETLRADGWVSTSSNFRSSSRLHDFDAKQFTQSGARLFAKTAGSCTDLNSDGEQSRLLRRTATSTQAIWATSHEQSESGHNLHFLSRTWHADAHIKQYRDVAKPQPWPPSSAMQTKTDPARGTFLRISPGEDFPCRVRPGDELWGNDSDFGSVEEEPEDLPRVAESAAPCAETCSLQSQPSMLAQERWVNFTAISHKAMLKASWVVPGAPAVQMAPKHESMQSPPADGGARIRAEGHGHFEACDDKARAILAAAGRANCRAGAKVGANVRKQQKRRSKHAKQTLSSAGHVFMLKMPPPVIIEHHHVHRHRHQHRHEVAAHENEAIERLSSLTQHELPSSTNNKDWQQRAEAIVRTAMQPDSITNTRKPSTPEGAKHLQKSISLPVLVPHQSPVSHGHKHQPAVGVAPRAAVSPALLRASTMVQLPRLVA
eukprot:TRINITY_DN4996_c0_g1_i2.p1 TRINITY_DN4996_c0_g1~~TRINITY_DN4996_c0_g1_i2.p1  ORF type:complete len:451 (+),score=74.52 TRINITY_DN4996_c0_g1_i2:78-1430(+)